LNDMCFVACILWCWLDVFCLTLITSKSGLISPLDIFSTGMLCGRWHVKACTGFWDCGKNVKIFFGCQSVIWWLRNLPSGSVSSIMKFRVSFDEFFQLFLQQNQICFSYSVWLSG
jgi:hypothetical protein